MRRGKPRQREEKIRQDNTTLHKTGQHKIRQDQNQNHDKTKTRQQDKARQDKKRYDTTRQHNTTQHNTNTTQILVDLPCLTLTLTLTLTLILTLTLTRLSCVTCYTYRPCESSIYATLRWWSRIATWHVLWLATTKSTVFLLFSFACSNHFRFY